MSDASLLFLVLAALYGWECACWLRRGSIACVTWFSKTWRVAHPGEFSGNQQGGFVFAAPLPPLGTILTANQLPLSISPQGVLTWVATSVNPNGRPQQVANFFPFSEIKDIKAKNRKLYISLASPERGLQAASTYEVSGDRKISATPDNQSGSGLKPALPFVIKTPSFTFASRIAAQLIELKALPLEKRASAVEEIFRASLDTKAIKKLWSEFQPHVNSLRWLTNGLFVYLFALTPTLIWYFGLKATWISLLIGLFTLTGNIAFFFYRAHRKFYPASADDRFIHTVTVLLAPASSMRACDMLSRPLLESFHPLALTKAFCPEETFREFAGKILRDVRHPFQPACPGDNATWKETELSSRTALQHAVERMLKQNKIDPEDLCRAPKPTDETCRSYCPRCLTQFTTTNGECADCGGMPFIGFNKNGTKIP